MPALKFKSCMSGFIGNSTWQSLPALLPTFKIYAYTLVAVNLIRLHRRLQDKTAELLSYAGVRIIESLSSLELKGCTIAVVSRARCSRCGDKQQVNRKRSIKKALNLNSKIEANDST